MFEKFDLLKGLKQCFWTKKHLFLHTPKIITYSWPQRGWLGGGSTLTVSLTVKYCFLAFYGQPILVHFKPLLIHLNLIWCKIPFLALVGEIFLGSNKQIFCDSATLFRQVRVRVPPLAEKNLPNSFWHRHWLRFGKKWKLIFWSIFSCLKVGNTYMVKF